MNVGIYYARTPKGGEKKDEGYLYVNHPQWRSYPHELLAALGELSDQAVVVCREQTYQGSDTFSCYWRPSVKEKGYFEKVDAPITLDAVFNKGYFDQPADLSLVNVTKLRVLGRDKAKQYELFGAWQPTTIIADTDTLADAIGRMPEGKVVVKPLDQNGGKGITIAPKEETIQVAKDRPTGHQWIVQQFIDSSAGIVGIQEGLHDLRLYVINGDPTLASIRTPKQGSLVANTSQGGSIVFHDIGQVPEEALALVPKVDKVMQQYGNRFYSIDLITDGTQWYILEINDRPGVPAVYQSDLIPAFHAKLARCIVESINNPLNKVV